jgi:hypothetical protein
LEISHDLFDGDVFLFLVKTLRQLPEFVRHSPKFQKFSIISAFAEPGKVFQEGVFEVKQELCRRSASFRMRGAKWGYQ